MYMRWHWLQWNFSPEHYREPYFARVTLDALLTCDRAMHGFADDMLGRLERIGGRDRNLDDYEQVKQWPRGPLAGDHLVRYPRAVPVPFYHEPLGARSQHKPE